MQKELLDRYKKNPILVPNSFNSWESKAVFNCGVLFYCDKIHMLYRAIGEYERYISRIGYASSIDGYNFVRRKETALSPYEKYEKYGIEDPRIVEIDHQIYVSYVVLSNYVSERPVASTALATTTDFTRYQRLGIITSKGSDNKDVVLFPENVNRQLSNRSDSTVRYFFLHRPSTWIGSKYGVDRPSIWLGEGNSLTKFEKHTLLIKPEQRWEMLKVGAGPALLDLSEPSNVLGRTSGPILEPKEPYEKNGDDNNVVLPTGKGRIDA